jgi:hypothetical protein
MKAALDSAGGTLVIVNRLGTVHAVRGGDTCPSAAAARRRRSVTPLQIQVYHLPPCESCWPFRARFAEAVA